jgi:hypothetical protein
MNMFWVFLWLVIWITYLVVSIIQIAGDSFTTAELIKTIAGFLGISSTFLLLLYQNSLTFYFYWTRFKNWFRNHPSKWQLDVRFDGHFQGDPTKRVSELLLQLEKDKVSVKVFHQTVNSINFSVYDTLNFYLTFQPKQFNQFEYDTIDIALAPFEIGCNDSKHKLDTKIIPILNRLQEVLKPDNSSYVLNISFVKGNPFFTVFISHLKTSQVSTFTVNLHLDDYSRGKAKDFVTIQKENVVINANDLHSLKQLAYDFIYLSSAAKRYIKAPTHA